MPKYRIFKVDDNTWPEHNHVGIAAINDLHVNPLPSFSTVFTSIDLVHAYNIVHDLVVSMFSIKEIVFLLH